MNFPYVHRFIVWYVECHGIYRTSNQDPPGSFGALASRVYAPINTILDQPRLKGR